MHHAASRQRRVPARDLLPGFKGTTDRLLRAPPGFEDKADCRRAHGLAGTAPSQGPYFGAGVWLKSRSSVMQVKFAAMLVLPLPLYFATLGKTQSGRVI
jgi:hypothetical protein